MDNIEEREDPLPVLKEIEFSNRIGVFGKSESGKSTFLKQFLKTYHNKFESIVLVSMSAKATKEFDNLIPTQHLKMKIVDSISEEELDHLLNEGKNKGRDAPHTLILLDDIIGMKGLKLKGDVMKELITSGRQYNISVIFSSQKFKTVPDYIRMNCKYSVFFNMNQNEIGKVYDELGAKTKRRSFIELYQDIVKVIGFGLFYRLKDQAWFLMHVEKFD